MQNNQLGCGCGLPPGCWPCGIGPQGPPGPVGATGPAGTTGPTGPTGAVAATIPFSIANQENIGVDFLTDAAGNPEYLHFVGFGGGTQYYPVVLQPGEWASGTITFTDSTFYGASFIVPYDATVQNIYVVFANRAFMVLDPGVTMRPFVCLAVSDAVTLTYRILPETMTFGEPYLGGVEYPKYSLHRGSLTNINTDISAGTLVGIVTGWLGEGVTEEQQGRFSLSGGIFMQ